MLKALLEAAAAAATPPQIGPDRLEICLGIRSDGLRPSEDSLVPNVRQEYGNLRAGSKERFLSDG